MDGTDLAIPPIEVLPWRDAIFAGRAPEDLDLDSLSIDQDPTWVIEYSTELFRAARDLSASYSPRQLRVGFNTLFTSWALTESIWRADLPWPPRQQCIISMVLLFKHVFAKDPLDTTCEMWWDQLRTFANDSDSRVTDAMFVALSQILYMPQADCQASALHGLGHLDHPNRGALIREWLRDVKPTDPSLRAYALRAASGKVL